MNTATHFYKEIMTGLLFVTGILSFLFGEFVISTVMFGTASLTSNHDIARSTRA